MEYSRKRYPIIENNATVLKHIEEIRWAESDGSYTVFHLPKGHTSTQSGHLGLHLKRLGKGFLRIHRTCFVNMGCVEKITNDGYLVLDCGQHLSIGKHYKKKVRAALYRY